MNANNPNILLSDQMQEHAGRVREGAEAAACCLCLERISHYRSTSDLICRYMLNVFDVDTL